MNKENYFINKIASNKFIGDDGAVILDKLNKKEKYVYSVDAFYEDVHFKKDWLTLEQIAKKSMLVNISDAIVMNAIPKYALLSIAIPPEFTNDELKRLANGFKKIAKRYGIKIIGGDTISNKKLDISITLISITKNPVYRYGTSIGDFVCHTGNLGSVKKDLQMLLNGEKISKKSKFIKPKLHGEFFYKIAPFINSALDISDGLFFELARLSKINNIGFEFLENIDEEIGCSGEEYEILFTFSQKNKNKIEKIADFYGVNLNIFAKANKGKFECICKEHHF